MTKDGHYRGIGRGYGIAAVILLTVFIINRLSSEELRPELNLGNGYYLYLALDDDDQMPFVWQAWQSQHGVANVVIATVPVVIYIGYHPNLNLGSDQLVHPEETQVEYGGIPFWKSTGEVFTNYTYREKRMELDMQSGQPIAHHYHYTVHIKNKGLNEDTVKEILSRISKKETDKNVYLGTESRYFILGKKGEFERAYSIISEHNITDDPNALGSLRRYLYALEPDHTVIEGHSFTIPHQKEGESDGRINIELQSYREK